MRSGKAHIAVCLVLMMLSCIFQRSQMPSGQECPVMEELTYPSQSQYGEVLPGTGENPLDFFADEIAVIPHVLHRGACAERVLHPLPNAREWMPFDRVKQRLCNRNVHTKVAVALSLHRVSDRIGRSFSPSLYYYAIRHIII